MSKAKDIAKTSGVNTGDETSTTIKATLGITTLSGSNTGDQTTISGNAGTATTLATTRNINGVSFDGSANITINAIDSTARIASSLIGSASGVCPLDASSKITATYLPSYVDDVLEYTNLAGFPVTGETGKIYVDLATNKTYRWSGSTYIYITSGAVDSVAGKTGVVTLNSTDVGLGNVTNDAQVTSVGGTAPISSTGGPTPTISISAATTLAEGTMSSSDKTKLDAITGTNTGDQTLPTTLPASDVYAWAKAATKPAYTYTEVGAQVAGTYATGTGSASGVNTGDETTATIKTALGISTLSGSNTGDQTAISGNAGTATSIAGQTANGVLYQSGSGVTASTLASTAIGQVLTTTTLGGVPTWETPSAGGGGVAGTTGQVQYNNAGAAAGASYVNISGGHLNVTDAGTIPTTPPAGTLTYFAEDHAGRMLPSVIGPSGVDFNLQSALYGNTNYMWLAGTATIAAISWGTAFTPVQAGTAAAQSHPAAKLSTNSMTSMNRANYGTGSTATGSAGVTSASTVAWLGNAAGLGGFLFFARFGVETASVNTYRVFVGLSGTGVVLAGEPSALINSIALVKDAADTTWFISTRGATTSAKTNTGITVTVGQVLDVYIHTAPNTSSVKVEIKNAVTGATLYVTPTAITATLPVNTMFMYMQAHIMSSAGTTAKLLGLNRMYLETDL